MSLFLQKVDGMSSRNDMMGLRTSISSGKATRKALAAWMVSANSKTGKGSLNLCIFSEICLNNFFRPSGEFWLGLENIHALSKQGQYILQVELEDWAGQQLPAARYRFQLDGEEKLFTLHLEDESPSGVQENVMSIGASGLPFSTADRDNDLDAHINCAELLSGRTGPLSKCTPNCLGAFITAKMSIKWKVWQECSFAAGGWWFSSCGESNLNGRYPRRHSGLRHQFRRKGMFWTSSKGHNYSVKNTLLKIAPATISQ